ncbi:MAG TPA: homocysteine S-methyltransferase family protein, partial [Candidatus Polarisedimenticolia bacterium]|nr:homocysteine S-methyltransferase family protein [Candidatus Polarisedimenticolia bacterium]
AIHEDYVRAGAEIVVTNTFRTTRWALERAGAGDRWRLFNRRAVECARMASGSVPGRACLVAGGLAPLEDCYRPDLVPPAEVCLAEHRRQVDLLAGLGVDLIMIETMNRRREAEAALRAAAASGLDVVLSLCPWSPETARLARPDGGAREDEAAERGATAKRPAAGGRILSGEPLDEVLPALLEAGGDRLRAVLLNCASPEALEPIYAGFAALLGERPHGLYAHLGEPDDVTGWRLPERHDPERYAAWMALRLEEGARLIGGCCGTTPAHIAALARLLAGPGAAARGERT